MKNKSLIVFPILLLSMLTTASIPEAALVLSNRSLTPPRLTLTGDLSPLRWSATPITTDGSDYTLTSVLAEIADTTTSGNGGLFMELWSVNSVAEPGSRLTRLTLDVDTDGEKTFTSKFAVSANTSYFVVTGADNGGGNWSERVNRTGPLPGTNDFNVDSGSWQLGTNVSAVDETFFSTNRGTSWTSGLLDAPLRMDIRASPVPIPGAVWLLGSGLLGLLGLRSKFKE